MSRPRAEEGRISIADAFERCRDEDRAAFIPYLTAGDPDLEATGELLAALVRGGADVIELGVPFSDPIADGPVNQRAAVRALDAGTTLAGILRLVAERRAEVAVPIVLFTYFNPILAVGVERFAEQAAASGVDGVLCVDLPLEEAEEEVVPQLRERGIDPIFLLSPTTTRKRVKRAARLASGFLYYVSRAGVTGEEGPLPEALLSEARKVRGRVSPTPLAVGFGIARPEQAATVAEVADGVVVGSALVRLVESSVEGGERTALARRLEDEVRRYVRALAPAVVAEE